MYTRVLTLGTIMMMAAASLAADHTKDSLEQVKKAISEKAAVLIDVREQKEWDAGHLKSAKLLPLSKIRAGVSKDELEKLIPKGKIVYMHCKSGGRCLLAADELKSFGFDIRPLKEGYDDLLQAGFEKAEK